MTRLHHRLATAPVLFSLILAVLVCCPSRARGELLQAEGKHHVIQYDKQDQRLAGQISAEADRVWAEVAAHIGSRQSQPVTIVIVPSLDAFGKLVGPGAHDWVVGVAVAHRRLIVLKPPRLVFSHMYNVNKTLRHEMAHIAIADVIPPERIPRWLNEGIAMREAKQPSLRDNAVIARAAAQKRLIPFSNLESRFPETETQVGLAYYQAIDFVDFLVDQYGYDGLQNLLNELKTDDAETAFQNAFSKSLDELELEWRRGIKTAIYIFSSLTGSLTIMLIGSVLLIVAYVRKRHIAKQKLAEWEEEPSPYTPLD